MAEKKTQPPGKDSMTTSIWIELMLCIIILVSVIWGWRAIKDKAGSWKPWVITLVILLLAMAVGAVIISNNKSAERDKIAADSRTVTPQRADWGWKLPPGKFFLDRNENAPGEGVAEIIPQTDKALLYADIPYIVYGSPERERIRLRNMGGKTWEGTWEQDNPAERGKVVLDEVAPGVYAGTITFKDDASLKARCHLKMK